MPNYKTTYVGKDTDIDQVIEIFGGLLHQLNYIMNNMDSQNVKRINTNSTLIKSADGATELDGSQLVMYDERNKKRLLMGKNKNGRFEFVLYDKNECESLKFDSNTGDAVFSGDITGSTITGSDINVENDIRVGDNIFIGDQAGGNTKSIKFYTADSGRSGASVTARHISNYDRLTLSAYEIVLSAAEGVKNLNGDDFVTKGSQGYVTIDGVDYPIHWN